MNRTALITLEIIIISIVLMFIIGTYCASGFYYDALIWVLLIALGFGAFYGLKKHNTPTVRRIIAILAVIALGISFAGILIDVPLLPATPAMGLTMSMVLILLHWRMKNQDSDAGMQDERSLRIGTYGISCSWYLTYVMVIFLSVAISFGGMQISANTVLLVFIIMMPVSTILFQYYFNKKGDVY
ncbi:hypothetical protein ACKUB1_07785 [Methanospirillum stamsii]|uniref:Uncharacterized protein n=1 Tax=Methanospirillum stamsii TaxID=1277351 RepID=A0A2V2NJT7_9EURY|nr:hypothetical protein [Methanospirillum stamsii]PWR75603.1 hypothetical protein DLD82_03195 [Methanospirillum stamsii]